MASQTTARPRFVGSVVPSQPKLSTAVQGKHMIVASLELPLTPVTDDDEWEEQTARWTLMQFDSRSS